MERFDDLIEQFRMEPEQGQIWLARQRLFLMQLPAFAALRRELLAEVGIERARRLLARMGYVAGSSDAKLARGLLGDENDQAFLAGPTLHALQGIVRVETVRMELDVEAGYHYVEQLWHGSMEADAHLLSNGPSAEPVCWMQIGHAAGFNSAFFGRSIMFKEVECRGMGHAHCRIIGKQLEDWEGETDPLGVFSSTPFMNTSLHASDSSLLEGAPDLVGTAPSFVTACRQIEKVARSNVTVLFLGETGVGKERFARMLHKISDRVDKPFIAVNCAALPESLIESELFGVEKGAFTGASQARPGRFELADGGTLFLDEIGTLTAVAQEKLLRVLQEREVERLGGVKTRKVDVRVVSATNADLAEEVRTGRFRADLYYRINVIPIRIPPLRERAADIPLLIRYFIKRFSARHKRNAIGLTRSAIRGLLQHSYPGNIRELENMIERGVVLANDGEPIALTDLFLDGSPLAEAVTHNEEKTLELMDEWLQTGSLETVVEKLVARAMIRADGNLSQAARLLGVSRRQLEYRVKSKNGARGTTSEAKVAGREGFDRQAEGMGLV